MSKRQTTRVAIEPQPSVEGSGNGREPGKLTPEGMGCKRWKAKVVVSTAKVVSMTWRQRCKERDQKP